MTASDLRPRADAPAAEPVAVIGLACRLPQAPAPARLWDLLRSGGDAVGEAPDGRFGPDVPPEHRRGGFLDDVDLFDAAFFGISPREACATDPRQRLMLELGWEALEDARIDPASVRGSAAGVFVGAIGDDYATLLHRLGEDAVDRHTMAGTHRGVIANRLSYALGLRGPSVVVDTAQSSSLVAVHLAAESLRHGDCDLAVAGGVHLNLAAESTLTADRFGGLSPDGRCHTFDARANGFVRGEGGGAVVLKTLGRALADGDRIHCVILGGAVNNDGQTEGLTVPGAAGQEEVLRRAYAQAGIAPASVQYVELHGSGTRVGDPVEAAALGAVLGRAHPADEPLLVGSVKTNIGHLEAAGGIAGLLKTMLSIAHRELPPSLNHTTPNPAIAFDELRLRVRTEHGPWPRPDRPLLAGVSSVGMGGTNCHLVIGEAPAAAASVASAAEAGGGAAPAESARTTKADGGATAPAESASTTESGGAKVSAESASAIHAGDATTAATGSGPPWILSARSPQALRGQADRLLAHLHEHPDADPADIGRSLLRTRSLFEHRAVLIPGSAAGLAALAAEAAAPELATGRTFPGPGPVFVFPGQGSQWVGMARGLLEASPVFAARIGECAEALAPFVEWSLLDLLRGAEGGPDPERVDVVQPALWAVMVSLATVWEAAGVRPAAVIGHSQGEISAATVAGALSLSDAARVVALRSRAIGAIAGRGGMLSIALGPQELEPWLRDRLEVSVAAYNGPAATVVSGPADALERLCAELTAAEHRARMVQVDYASHSPEVEPIRDRILEDLAPLAPRTAQVPLFSTVTGDVIDTASMDDEYWYTSLRQTVRFADAAKRLVAEGHRLFLEISPHPVLTGSITDLLDAADVEGACVGTLRRDDGSAGRFWLSVAEAFAHGATVDWDQCLRGAGLVDLPTYAFQRESYWLEDPGTYRVGQPAGPTGTARPSGHRSSEAGVPESRNQLDLVRGHAAAVLGHRDASAVDAATTFKDLGLDSQGAVELRNRLSRASGLRLPTGVLYDYPTPESLSARLRELAAEAGPRETSDPEPRATRGAVGADRRRTPADHRDPIAIVAMSCRFPGDVRTPQGLWDVVADGTVTVSPFPENRGWNLAGLFAEGPDGRPAPSSVRLGGFLHDADLFDAEFFGISPREAAAMDPQQRLVLETSWEVLERAGIEPTSLRGQPVGVFVGATAQDYGPRMHQPIPGSDGHVLTGTYASVISGRVSYHLGLEGPTVTVDTACSSSLVAMHLAAAALRRGECSLALAGGVSVMSTPGIFVEFSRQRGLAADGRCKPFAAAADGTAWSEGVGMLVLERLSDARANGHRVLAVVRGSAMNHDGASNGLTAPNGPAQQRVIRAALAAAALAPHEVDAVDAHGTGTALGDPIEAEALLAAYGRDRAGEPLWLGSLKSNTGHTQAAAGVASVIKMVQALEHRTLPATVGVDEPTPHVDWSGGDVRLLLESRPWPETGRAARAAVSSFGISGTNAHLILEQAPDIPKSVPQTPDGAASAAPTAWTLSARTPAALRDQARRLLEAEPDGGIADIGFTLATTRTPFEHRAVALGRDRSELLAAVRLLADGDEGPDAVVGRTDPGRLAFLFPGQGSQRVGMGRELYEAEPVFARALDEAFAELDRHLDIPLREAMWTRDSALIDRTEYTQPALFALQVALHRLLEDLGVRPDALAGHSVGEIAAAHVAGVLSLADAARLVTARARLMASAPGDGAMAALEADEDEVRPLLEHSPAMVDIAAVNGPKAVVVSGAAAAVERVAEHFARLGRRTRRLAVSTAPHSPLMDPVLEPFREAVSGLEFRPARLPIVSTVTGTAVGDEFGTPDYWVGHVRRAVRFGDAIAALHADGVRSYAELGVDGVLTAMAKRAVPPDSGVVGVPLLRKDQPEPDAVQRAIAVLYVRGRAVDWTRRFPSARTVDLPTYPFQRERHWIDAGPPTADATALGLAEGGHPLLGTLVELGGGTDVTLTGRLSLDTHGWLADHAIGGTAVLPGAALAELGCAAGNRIGRPVLADLALEVPLPIPDPSPGISVQVTARADGQVAVYARAGEEPWTRHASGRLEPAKDPDADGSWAKAWPPPGATPVGLADGYERLRSLGYEYGPVFQGLSGLWKSGRDVYAEVRLPENQAADHSYLLHPALLDAALHAALLEAEALELPPVPAGQVRLPFAWRGVSLSGAAATGSALVRLTAGTVEGSVAVALADQDGTVLGTVDSLALRPVPLGRLAGGGGELFEVEWTAATPGAVGEESWAVLREAAALAAVENAQACYDFGGLTDALAYGGEAPSFVAAAFTDEGVCATEAPSSVAAAFGDGGASTTRGVHRVVGEALDLLQAWLADDRLAASRLVVLTRDAVAASPGEDVADLAGAAVRGLVRTAQAEHPGRFVLVDTDGEAASAAAIAAAVATGEPEAAVRYGKVLTPRLVQTRPAGEAAAWSPDGTVLITGGTGALGAATARHLAAAHGVQHFLLISRNGAQADGAERIAADLERLGARVDIESCDTADAEALRRVLAAVPAEHPITAVVHAAGTVEDAAVENIGPRSVAAVLRAKVDGAWNLHELTRDLPLSAFVLFSSAVATFGNPGQGAYSAANAFLDALASRRRAAGLPALALGWGRWESAGMAAALTPAQIARMARTGIAPLTEERALAVFDAAQAADRAHVLATALDMSALRERAEQDTMPPLFQGLVRGAGRRGGDRVAAASGAATSALARQLAEADDAERDELLEQAVRGAVARVLALSSPKDINPERAFGDLGFDSLTAVELHEKLSTATGLTLPTTLVFDYPTVSGLIDFLRERLAAARGTAADRALAELARLQEALAGVTGEGDSGAALRAGLRALLARLGDAGGDQAASDDAPLAGASDGEIFAYLDDLQLDAQAEGE